jgi:ferritin
VGHDGHALFFVDKDLAEMAKTGNAGSIMTDLPAQ